MDKDFKYHLKQRGALTAKGRVMGVQFDQLLQGNLIFDLAAHANKMAAKMATAFKALDYTMLIDSDTNQIFPILTNEMISRLQKDYSFLTWSVVEVFPHLSVAVNTNFCICPFFSREESNL